MMVTLLASNAGLSQSFDASGTGCYTNPTPGSANDVCFVAVSGCTDPLADNYDSSANTDDGSCTYVSSVAGCTSSDIIISEGHTSGVPEDFIEIQNISGLDCDMAGWQLDDSDGFSDYTFTTAVIPAGGFWYGDEDASMSAVYDASGAFVDSVSGSFG